MLIFSALLRTAHHNSVLVWTGHIENNSFLCALAVTQVYSGRETQFATDSVREREITEYAAESLIEFIALFCGQPLHIIILYDCTKNEATIKLKY